MNPCFANSALVHVNAAYLRRGAQGRLALPVRYGLIDSPLGPALIDTGYDHALFSDSELGRRRSLPLRAYAGVFAPEILAAGQTGAFLSRQGLRPDDIGLIILTHFHADHIGALHRFPKARIMASGSGLAALLALSPLRRLRHAAFTEFLPPDLPQRLTGFETRPLRASAPALPKGHDLFGDGRVLAIPLPGHALGHHGIFWPATGLLYAADTHWLHDAPPPPFPGRLVAPDPRGFAASLAAVQSHAASGAPVIYCHAPAPTPWDEPWKAPC
ncbi:MBL fold metallo-hydrolase [Neotabrizicola sp. sgz301269]|uniref:MBL fold metallo-hydrolase n=1 Tax=Neotabrizicola sp. sgz301269 TaxID=3276282 RepID=UPI00376FAF0F